MFCKNCGEQYQTDEAVICVKCGTAKGHGKLVIKPVLSLFPKLQGTYESWCIN